MNELNRNRLIDAENKLVVATRDSGDHCVTVFREKDKDRKIRYKIPV